MSKYYAVRKGITTGLFTDWASCQQAIKGFSNAEFKSFSTEDDALRYLMGENIAKQEKVSMVQPLTDNKTLNVFTTGKYVKEQSYCGLAVIIESLSEEQTFLCRVEDAFCTQQQSIAGSLLSAYLGLQLALSMKDYDKINIYSKYDGIQKWANSEWIPKNPIVSAFVRTYKEGNLAKRIVVYSLNDKDKLVKQKLKYAEGFALSTRNRLTVEQITEGNLASEILEQVVE